MIDQKTIAERAGVSRATVSRAFTQSAGISPKTLAKIQNAMISLGLQPLAWFPNAVQGKSKYVLIIVSDVANPFYSQILKGICDRALALGLTPVVCNSNSDPQIEESQIEFANLNNYAGIILVTAIESVSLAAALKRTHIPVIFVNRYIHSMETNTVCIDNYRGGYMAASHLLENGHRNIAYVATFKNTTPQKDRIRGFQAALADMSYIKCKYDIFYGDNSIERSRSLIQELVNGKMAYTALFVADCNFAMGIVFALQDYGYKIPQDLSILCFDDSPIIGDFGVRLSTIAYSPYKMGGVTVESLVQQMNSTDTRISHTDLFPELICRNSVRNIQEA